MPLTVDLTGYKVAITAGANGIGKVMADSFAYCGAKVFISDIDGVAVASCGHAGMVADAGEAVELICTGGVGKAMSRFNRKAPPSDEASK